MTFHVQGAALDDASRVAAWRRAAEAAPTAEAFAETYLGHSDSELQASVVNGRLIVETRPDVKNVVTPDGREARMAYFRLDVALTPEIMAELAEILIARTRAWEGALH